MTFHMQDGDLMRYSGADADAIVPEGVRNIADYAFENARVVRVTLPSTLRHIGKGVFTGCARLKEVVVKEGVEQLGLAMFPGCEKLERVVIPSTVTSLSGVFDGTRELRAPKASDVACMPNAIEVMSTREQLNPSLKACLPDDADVLAYILAFQNHVNWMKALEEKVSPTNAGAVFSGAVSLVSEENELTAKKATHLVSFGLNHFNDVDKESLIRLQALLKDGGKKLVKPLSQIESDPRVASAMSNKGAGGVIEPAGDNPFSEAESRSISAIVWDPIAQRVQGAVKTGVKYAGSEQICHPSVLVYVISEYARQAPDRNTIGRSRSKRVNYRRDYWDGAQIIPAVDSMATLLDRAELCGALGKMLDRANPINEAVAAYARYADETHVPKLVEMMKAWVKSWKTADEKNAYIARGALMLNETKAAMRYFESLKLLDVYARRRGCEAEELRNKMADFGLDENGSITFDLGEKTVIASLGPGFSWTLADVDSGKQYKSIPKGGADPDKFETARADFAAIKKETKKLVKARSETLFDDFLSGRSAPVGNWVKAYLENPVMKMLAETVVWLQDGTTFTLSDGGAVDSSGAIYAIGKDNVAVAHPAEMDADEILKWQDYYDERACEQPFAQMSEPVVVGEGKPIKRDRYKGQLVPVRRFMGKEKHGLHVDFDGHVTFGEDFRFDIYEGIYDGVDGFYDACIISADGLSVKYVWDDQCYLGATDRRIEIVEVIPKRNVSRRLLNHVVSTLDSICLG